MKTLLAEAQSGAAMADALKHWAQRTEAQNLYLLVNALLVQREAGGNLADLLQVVGVTMKKNVE